MNIPLSWLKDVASHAVNITDDTPVFLEKMTSAGNAVESVTHLGQDITQVVIGQIKSLSRHPDADKLWVTQTSVSATAEPLQIITGADNLSVGDYIPVVVHGGTIVGGVKIKKGKMRGLDSNGMLCSIGELGYTVADFPEATEEGIYVFPAEIAEKISATAPGFSLGDDARPIMGLLEDVVEFDILSNRPDTNSVIGMAREAAAVYGVPFTPPLITVNENNPGSTTSQVGVTIAAPQHCLRYVAQVVANVTIGPSPQWLRRRLSTAGIRPVNNIVDITNYVMLEYGQPLHAFDLSAVSNATGKHEIIVRTAQPGETLTTLDGEERPLPENTLLITDPTKILGIAGVMGGEGSKITADTTTILFESACFDSANIRLTSRKLGLRTDASGRYEKGQDPHQAMVSIRRAMELVQQLACGDVLPQPVDQYPALEGNSGEGKFPSADQKTITFLPENIANRLGVDPAELTERQICTYLNNLGIATQLQTPTDALNTVDAYAVAGGDKIEAHIPSYRMDLLSPTAGEADIAEEVARFYGLNNIKPRYSQILDGTSIPGHVAGKPPRRTREDGFKRTLVGLGYSEAMTYPFESPKVYEKLLLTGHTPIALKNPLGEDFSILRSSILNGLLESLGRNFNKGNDHAALFEIAHTYHKNEEETGFIEKPWLTLMAYGNDLDYLSLKGDAEAFLATVTNRPTVFETWQEYTFMHPGRTAKMHVKVSPNPRDQAVPIGILGQLHPTVQKNYHIGRPVYIMIFDLNPLHQVADAYKFKFKTPGIYPAITRDIAFTVAEDTPAADLENAIIEKGGQYFAGVTLFDVYQGQQVEAGHKSMAYSIQFRSAEKTLTVPEVQKSLDQILQNLQKKYKAIVRG